MTDAREIIANGLTNHGMTFPPPDAVTVGRIVEFAKDGFERDFDLPIGWRDQFAAAIRAIGRKA